MKRTQSKWDEYKSKLPTKIKRKSVIKAKTVAAYSRNQTTSKRRMQAEQDGYVDCKSQAKQLMKAEVERVKSAEKKNKKL